MHTTLFLNGKELGLEGAAMIGEALKVACPCWQRRLSTQVNHTLTGLNLSSNQFFERSAKFIGDALKVIWHDHLI